MSDPSLSEATHQAVERDSLMKLCQCGGRHFNRLTFDPLRDPPTPEEGPMRDYLRFYRLEFDNIAGTTTRSGHLELAGYCIAAHYWLPAVARGTVFLVHGYFDHVGLYRHLIRFLLQQNLAVVAFDLPGHGISSGERVSIASFDRYVHVLAALLERCRERLPQPWHGIGQRTGSAILLKYIMVTSPDRQDAPLSSVHLLCPLIRPVKWPLSVWIYRLSHRWRERVPRSYRPSSHDPEFLDFVARQDPLQDHYISVEWVGAMKRWIEEFQLLPPCDYPFHVIQGTADTTVDWRYNLTKMKAKLTRARFTLIDGARHQLVNEAPAIRQRVFEALTPNLAATHSLAPETTARSGALHPSDQSV